MKQSPQFLILSASDCREVLEHNHVGRLAFLNGSTVDIEPLGYVCRDNWLFLRSAYGTKLEALAHNPYVAFEVDESAGALDWRSVVVHGSIYMFPADGSVIERRERERAIEALRELIPAAFTADDPTPARQIVYGLHVDQMVGRMARSFRASDRAGRLEVPVRTAPMERRGPNG